MVILTKCEMCLGTAYFQKRLMFIINGNMLSRSCIRIEFEIETQLSQCKTKT